MKNQGAYVLTPQGRVPRSRVHHVEEGQPEPLRSPLAPLPPNDLLLRSLSPNGWKASATFASYVPLGKMSVKFTVPEHPSVGGAIIYLFPGAENAQMRTILQPVLQWGDNGCFGGDYWSLACWHASNDGSWYHSTPQQVSTGEIITASVEAIHCTADACTWCIEARTDNVSTSHRVNDVPSLMLFLIGAALEAYPEDPCCTTITREQYPASETVFTDIQLLDLAGDPFVADWNPRCDLGENSLCGCKNTVKVSDDRSTITLQY